jgi:hypothetical protein
MKNASKDNDCPRSEFGNNLPGPDGLGEDKLSGVGQISDFLGESPRRTYYLLEKGLIHAGKLGNLWVGSKRKIRKKYNDLTGGAA